MVAPLNRQLELAGMVGIEGLLGRGWLPIGEAHPPAGLRLDETQQRLEWHEPTSGMTDEEWAHYRVSVMPPPTDPTGMLDAFIRIRRPNDVLRFACRFGPLRLCEHGMPSTHRPPYLSDGPLPQDAYCKPKGYPSDCSEPIDRWLFYGNQARALLEIGAALWTGKPGPKTAWKAVVADMDKESQEQMLNGIGETLTLDRAVLSAFVSSSWIRAGNVCLHWFWAPGRDKPSLWMGREAFSILAIQLVSALTRAHGVAICDGCSEPYLRSGRRPQANRRNFCPACGKRAANRLRQRDLRARRTA